MVLIAASIVDGEIHLSTVLLAVSPMPGRHDSLLSRRRNRDHGCRHGAGFRLLMRQFNRSHGRRQRLPDAQATFEALAGAAVRRSSPGLDRWRFMLPRRKALYLR